MRYPSGQDVHVGDVVSIDTTHSGTVTWCTATNIIDIASQAEDWSYLGVGCVINTSFAGPVHYWDEKALADDKVVLLHRSGDA